MLLGAWLVLGGSLRVNALAQGLPESTGSTAAPAPPGSPDSEKAPASSDGLTTAPPEGLAVIEETVECGVTYVTADSIYLDAGSQSGIEVGLVGMARRGGDELGRVEVIEVTRRSCVARPLGGSRSGGLQVRDRVSFTVKAPARPEDGSPSTRPGGATGAAAAPGAEEDGFEPLLAPLRHRAANWPEPSNLSSGRLHVRQMFQIDGESSEDYSITRVGTSGAVDRIEGTPWSFEWSGDLSYRDGHAFEGSRDLREPRLDVYRLFLRRRLDDGGFLRLGRFLPSQLPGVGHVDGAQVESILHPSFRIGAIAGLKPRRNDLDVSTDEPLATLYASGQAGKRGELYYSGTLGLLGSLYRGKVDRLAILLDQQADLGPKLSIFSTSEVDFDVGGREVRSGTRLSRMDLYAIAPLWRWLTLKGGFDRYERPDTAAERDLTRIVDERAFDRGYTRYWVGASHALPGRFRVDEEVSLYDAPQDDGKPRWRVGLSRTGTLLEGDSLRLVVFNLVGADADGYGGRLDASFPFLDSRLWVRPGVGFRFLETDATSERFSVTEAALYADWELSRIFSAYAGVTQSFGDSLQSTLVEMGIEARW